MKKGLILLLVCMSFGLVKAQDVKPEAQVEKESKVSLNVALKNRHLWRCGQGINGFSVQSTLSYNLPFLSVGAWGAYELGAQTYGEVDIFVEAYFLNYFTFGLYDFYYPDDFGGRKVKDFTDLQSPNHVIDAFLKYSGTEKLPLGGLVAAYVYGGSDQDENGDQRYSTYLEMNYTLTLNKTSNIFFYVGATTSKNSAYAAKKPIYALNTKTNEQELMGYGAATDSDFNIIGLGAKYTKNFKIGKFDANASGEFLYNPNVDAVYMALATSINF